MRVILIVTLLMLSACSGSSWWGADEKKVRLEGKRISILTHRNTLEARPAQGRAVITPEAITNNSWPLQAARPAEHLAISTSIRMQDVVSIGDTPGERLRLTSTPVVTDGVIFTLDGDGAVTARTLANPDRLLWEYEIEHVTTESEFWDFDDGEKEFIGGNLAVADGHVIVATATGDVLTLDGANGALMWQRRLHLPLRSAPTVADGAIYVTTSNSRLYSLSAADGSTRWTYDGINEKTSIFGAPRAVVEDSAVIAAFASGELVVLEAETGRERWKDMLINNQASFASLVTINDVDATPLVHQGSVYAISHDGVLAAYNLDTGRKRWTQNVSSVQTPWVAGEYLFVVTVHDELAAINALDGRIQWVSSLPTHADAGFTWDDDAKGEPIDWSGPVLAANMLWLVGSDGRLIAVNVADGAITNEIDIRDAVYLPPVVVDKTMLILGNDAKMMVLQ